MMARVLDSPPDPLANYTGVPPWLSDVIDRCLKKQPQDRFSTASDLLHAFEHPVAPPRLQTPRSTWWRTHQVVAIVLYTIATARGWQIKEWLKDQDSISLWVFIVMGIAASVGGIIRGHLVFTDVMNHSHLRNELLRTKNIRLLTDVLMAALLTIDALLLAPLWPLAAVLTIALATGIALAAVLMEPATTTVLLGE